MGSSDDKCLFCFPIECGVSTLGVLTILSFVTICVESFMYAEDNLHEIYWPLEVAVGIMSVIWVVQWSNPTETTRKITFFAWVLLVVCFCSIYLLVIILNGSMLNHFCHEETVTQVNDLGVATSITVEECKMDLGKKVLLTDYVVKTMLNSYFAFVLLRWSKKEDGWDRA